MFVGSLKKNVCDIVLPKKNKKIKYKISITSIHTLNECGPFLTCRLSEVMVKVMALNATFNNIYV